MLCGTSQMVYFYRLVLFTDANVDLLAGGGQTSICVGLLANLLSVPTVLAGVAVFFCTRSLWCYW